MPAVNKLDAPVLKLVGSNRRMDSLGAAPRMTTAVSVELPAVPRSTQSYEQRAFRNNPRRPLLIIIDVLRWY